MPRPLPQPASRRRPTHAARCRGSVYLLVLGTSMLVTLLGLTAMLLARVERRMDTAVQDAAQARLLAQSAVELALQRMEDDSTWRHAFTHNVWINDATLGRGALSFRFTDPDDASLSDDPGDPVVLTGRGRVGDAVRLCQVRLEPPASSNITNLLVNSGAEGGLVGWEEFPDNGDVDLAHESDDFYAGTYSFRVKNRETSQTGIAQDVTSHVKNGASYDARAAFWLKDGAEDVKLALRVRSTGDAGYLHFAAIIGGVGYRTWTEATGVLTPTWNGELVEAVFYAATSTTDQDFCIDQLSFAPRDSAPLSPVPTSWRQVVE